MQAASEHARGSEGSQGGIAEEGSLLLLATSLAPPVCNAPRPEPQESLHAIISRSLTHALSSPSPALSLSPCACARRAYRRLPSSRSPANRERRSSENAAVSSSLDTSPRISHPPPRRQHASPSCCCARAEAKAASECVVGRMAVTRAADGYLGRLGMGRGVGGASGPLVAVAGGGQKRFTPPSWSLGPTTYCGGHRLRRGPSGERRWSRT